MKKQTICITGASKGIGRAIATEFAGPEYNFILNTGSDQKGLDELVKSLTPICGKDSIWASVGNIGDPTYVSSFFKEALDTFGTIDILINNAGVSYVGLLTDMSISQWQSLMDTNLNALFYTCREVIPGMIHQKCGRILNISSMWGNVGASCEVAYSASKGGVNTFTKALAKELAPSGISVNALSCGCVDTAMNACFSEEEKQALSEEIPIGRFATPKEVAQAAKKLIEMPDYVTGQIVTMDGGYL